MNVQQILTMLNRPTEARARVGAWNDPAVAPNGLERVHHATLDTWRWVTLKELVVQDPAGNLYGIIYETQPEELVQEADQWAEYEVREVVTLEYTPKGKN